LCTIPINTETSDPAWTDETRAYQLNSIWLTATSWWTAQHFSWSWVLLLRTAKRHRDKSRITLLPAPIIYPSESKFLNN
jgi:hypothetical protein